MLDMLLEWSLICTLVSFVCMISRLVWPCLIPLTLVVSVIVFIACLALTLAVHAAAFPCWRMHCQGRRRLFDTDHRTRVRLGVVVPATVFVLSVLYGAAALWEGQCHTPWWPALVVAALAAGVSRYTVCTSSSSDASSSPSENASDSLASGTAAAASSAPSNSSSGMSSEESSV